MQLTDGASPGLPQAYSHNGKRRVLPAADRTPMRRQPPAALARPKPKRAQPDAHMQMGDTSRSPSCPTGTTSSPSDHPQRSHRTSLCKAAPMMHHQTARGQLQQNPAQPQHQQAVDQSPWHSKDIASVSLCAWPAIHMALHDQHLAPANGRQMANVVPLTARALTKPASSPAKGRLGRPTPDTEPHPSGVAPPVRCSPCSHDWQCLAPEPAAHLPGTPTGVRSGPTGTQA
jgi:hypothetical protein